MTRYVSGTDTETVATLQRAHATLSERVRELDRRAILTPREQQERAALKKQKLAVKDEIVRASQIPPEPAADPATQATAP